jgi:hypothetical protein
LGPVIGIALALGSLAMIDGASVLAFLPGFAVSAFSMLRGVGARLSSSGLDLDDGSR